MSRERAYSLLGRPPVLSLKKERKSTPSTNPNASIRAVIQSLNRLLMSKNEWRSRAFSALFGGCRLTGEDVPPHLGTPISARTIQFWIHRFSGDVGESSRVGQAARTAQILAVRPSEDTSNLMSPIPAMTKGNRVVRDRKRFLLMCPNLGRSPDRRKTALICAASMPKNPCASSKLPRIRPLRCAILGLSNTAQAVSRLDEDERGIIQNDTLGGFPHFRGIDST
jgi:hypothetical protein